MMRKTPNAADYSCKAGESWKERKASREVGVKEEGARHGLKGK
jgi:hypothetical protein